MSDPRRRLRQALTKSLELFIVAAMSLLVLDVVWGVFSRYVLGSQTEWTEELARFLLVWVALLGGALAFGRQAHLGVDYFVERLHPEARQLMTVIGHSIVLLFAGIVFLGGGVRAVIDALLLDQATPALGWKMGYVYLVLPLAGCYTILYTLENLFVALSSPPTATGKDITRTEGVDG